MIRIILYTMLLVFCFSSCGQKNKRQEVIDGLLDISLENKSIDDFNQLYNLTTSCPNCLDSLLFNEVVNNGKVDRNALEKIYFNEKIDDSEFKIKAQIFLENSASMWGYFKGSTDAETVISRVILHSGIAFKDEKSVFAYITDSIYQQKPKEKLDQFILRLEPSDMVTGNYSDTQIADILKRVVVNTDVNALSILFSDCIYSINNSSSKEYVKSEWALIESAFSHLLERSDFSVLIVKYISQFNGAYYSLLDSGREYKNIVGEDKDFSRPYYAIVIGQTNLFKEALEEIDFKSYVGYQNSYFITQPTSYKRIDYKIINKYKIGKFRPDKKNRKVSIIKAKSSTKGIDKGNFQYTIAANLTGLGIEEDYIKDDSKYDITGSYSLKVIQIPESDKRLDKNLSKYSHYLHVKTSEPLKEEEVFISLRRETPQWILNTHTDDDSDLSIEFQSKTRGFRDLIKGIENAFDFAYRKVDKESSRYYFTIQTKVNL